MGYTGGSDSRANQTGETGNRGTQTGETSFSRRRLLQATAGVGFVSAVGARLQEPAVATESVDDDAGTLLLAEAFDDGKLTDRDSYDETPHPAGLEPKLPRPEYTGDLADYEIVSDGRTGSLAVEGMDEHIGITDASIDIGRDVRYEFWMTASGGGDGILNWCVQDDRPADGEPVDSYAVQHGGSSTNFRVRRYDSDNGDEGLYSSSALESGEWYWFVVEHSADGTIEATVFDEPGGEEIDSSGEIQDDTYESGGIGWQSNTSEGGTHDDLRVFSLADPAQFNVELTETNTPVVVGDTLEVTVAVENTGDENETQTLVLEIDGQEEDAVEETLDGGESAELTLEWSTTDDDAGSYDASVSSRHETAETDVTVHEPAAFDIEITETNEPVVEENTLEVTAVVENVGDESGTQTITLEIDGQEEDTVEETLDGGESTELTLDWRAEEGDAGNYRASVTSDDDSDDRDVTIHDAAGFLTTLAEMTVSGESEELLEVATAVENTQNVSDTQTITLDINGEEVDTQSVTLDSGESSEITLEWPTENRNSVGVRVASDDDWDNAYTRLETVDRVAHFAVEIVDSNAPIVPGETLEVNIDIENTGDAEDTQQISLDINAETVDFTDVTLDGGESETVTLEWEAGDRSGVGVRVASDDDWDNASLSINTLGTGSGLGL